MIDDNKGKNVFNLLVGTNDEKQPEKPSPHKPIAQPDQTYPWGNEWLSVHNDYLFEEI